MLSLVSLHKKNSVSVCTCNLLHLIMEETLRDTCNNMVGVFKETFIKEKQEPFIQEK